MFVIFLDKEWNPPGFLLSEKMNSENPGCQGDLA